MTKVCLKPYPNYICSTRVSWTGPAFIWCRIPEHTAWRLIDYSALCDSISAFSKACSDVSRPINWRSPSFCPVTCPPNSHYDYCGPLCVDSCSDSQRGSKCKTANCIEGCFCDAGYLWDGLQCVRRESCGCVNGDISYRIGQTFYKKNCAKKCKCVGINHEECEEEGCRNNQECVKTDANIGRSVGNGREGALGLFGGAIEREPEYNCVKSTKPKVKEDPNGGTSFHLPLMPSDDDDYDILNIGGRSKNITKPKRPNRPDRTDNVPLANDPMRTIPMGPLVEFPDCLPKVKWTRGQVKPDWIPPNKCCGNKPYNDMVSIDFSFGIGCLTFGSASDVVKFSFSNFLAAIIWSYMMTKNPNVVQNLVS